jgi:hypothetical protein
LAYFFFFLLLLLLSWLTTMAQLALQVVFLSAHVGAYLLAYAPLAAAVSVLKAADLFPSLIGYFSPLGLVQLISVAALACAAGALAG